MAKISKNAPKGTTAVCRGCGHDIVSRGGGIWADNTGTLCESRFLGEHRPK